MVFGKENLKNSSGDYLSIHLYKVEIDFFFFSYKNKTKLQPSAVLLSSRAHWPLGPPRMTPGNSMA